MPARRPLDAVDAILAQWRRERPDLDPSPMAVIGRVGRCAALLQRRLEPVFQQFGLTAGEFDVLATLRRAGPPHSLAPTALFSSLMVTSGTMTHRLQRLEAQGLVTRRPNAEDARSLLVQLTSRGLALIDRAVEAHLDNEHRILAGLSPAERKALENALAALLRTLEEGPPPGE
ncbi:MAG TPA: MarR family transcriptional regulator [Burkholderiaceae bacterium]|nr:MarR family transcriptional regulator [Burkholderiaceae bacterium]